MKLTDIKEQIDAYFKKVTPEEIVKQFQSLGYQFEEIDNRERIFAKSVDYVLPSQHFLQNFNNFFISEINNDQLNYNDFSNSNLATAA